MRGASTSRCTRCPGDPQPTHKGEVRFDWRTGHGRGVELNQPPFNLKTQELFRAEAPPHEIIVTERVFMEGVGVPAEPDQTRGNQAGG